MINRLRSRFGYVLGLLLVGGAVTSFVLMIGLLGYLVMNWNSPSPGKKDGPIAASQVYSISTLAPVATSTLAPEVVQGADLPQPTPSPGTIPEIAVATKAPSATPEPVLAPAVGGATLSTPPLAPATQEPIPAPEPPVIIPASAVASAPWIPHPLEGRAKCVSCHLAGDSGAGTPGGTGMPSTHAGRSDATCLNCHDLEPAPTEIPAGAPAGDPVATAVPVPAILHPIAGRESCISCHTEGGPGAGTGGGTGLPVSHQGRGNETCQSCHAEVQLPPAPSAVPGTTPNAPVGVPAILHTTEGNGNCTGCHAVGGPGIGTRGGTGLAPTHQGRGDATCQTCHTTTSPGVTPVVVPAPAIPHITSGVTQCLPCHTLSGSGVGAPGGPGMSRSHDGRPDSSCRGCHTSTGSSTLVAKGSRIEHGLQGRTDCTSCHYAEGTTRPSGGGKTKSMPKNHKGRTSGICLACHRI